MIDALNNLYLEKLTELNKLASIMDIHYSVASVMGQIILHNNSTFGTPAHTLDIYTKIKDDEYKDRIKFDCALIETKAITKQIITYYKTFHDEIKNHLDEHRLCKTHYDAAKKLADGTLLATKEPAQKEL